MIHFDFTVTDEEAENIFDAISEEILRMKSYLVAQQFENLTSGFHIDAKSDWFRSRINYLERLKSKMKNEKV